MRSIHILVLLGIVLLAAAFSKEDHDIFRLRDEVEASEGPGTTFYDFLGVESSATVDDIKKAFRKKSRSLHPDKVKQSFIASKSTPAPKKPGEKKKKGVHVSKGPSQGEIKKAYNLANARYQRLSVVGKFLQGAERERYDHFMRHGFPAWRGTGYYYSRYRPGLGTVIFGLFLVGGGAAHYFALTMSYRRQREFMERYIRSARKQAWGDEAGIAGIPTGPAPVELPADEPTDPMTGMNRRQKREMEKQQKKDNKNGKGKSTKSESKPEKISSPTGERRRVVAENGKVLVVDSLGNVFLEEEDEDGNVDEFPLDIDEIHKPTFRDTAVVRLPIWLYRKAFDPFLKDTTPVPSDEVPLTETEKEDMSDLTVPAMSSSRTSDSGFELVDATGIEEDKNTGSGKKRRKGKK